MTDVDQLLASRLERLVPPPTRDRADWGDVLRRAGLARRTRRRAGVALAGLAAAVVVAVATPVGAAIADGIGDFSAWLTGHPGKQAPASEQRAFDTANGRSWASFPKGTELRELIRTKVGGEEYVLFGFRSGTSLCLRLTGPERRDRRQPACVPTSTIARAAAPIAVVTGNGAFYDRSSHVSAQYSFGIAADGVERVDVYAPDGTHRALLGGNAYLWIEREPNTGNRVERISVTGADGRTANVAVNGYGLTMGAAPSGRPGGPTRVDRKIPHPTIGWSVRHEKRGLTAQQARIDPQGLAGLPGMEDARFFKPDPLSNIVVGLSGSCLVVVDGAAACGDQAHVFTRGPLHFLLSSGGSTSSDQSLGFGGAAADGVARIDAFLPDGGRQAVPLEDNMFATLVPNRFPFKLVSYDSAGRVVGIQMFPSHGLFAGLSTPPAAKKNLRRVLRVTGPHGAAANLSIGHVVEHQQCWRVDFSTGRSGSGCDSAFFTGPKIVATFVQPAGRDLFVVGGVDDRATAHVELQFDNGDVLEAHPVAGRFIFAIPRAHLSTQRHFAYVVAVDRHGHRVQRQGIAFRSRP